MLYREMGRTGEKVSILGFGCMRLPTKGRYDQINEEKAQNLLNYALEHGINYFDTAYSYHSLNITTGGQSEVFLGDYFKDNPWRDDIYIATKLPTWLLEEPTDMDRFLDEQLNRLQSEQIDFYLLHSLKEKKWFHLEDLGILEFLDSAKEDGRIRYAGFSSHDETSFVKEVIDSYEWDMCQIQYNYLDENIQAGIEGLKYAAQQNIGVAVMEPLKGGVLANSIPVEVQDIYDSASIQRKPAEWAFLYLWNNPEICTVLSGMNTIEHLKENVITAESGLPHSFSDEEKRIMEEVKSIFQNKICVECTACGYCMPCPSGVNIPQCFSYLNQVAMLKDKDNVSMQYFFMLSETERASNCTECGLCEELCSQGLSIREKLKDVKKTFGQ